jgi:hypothetical protein
MKKLLLFGLTSLFILGGVSGQLAWSGQMTWSAQDRERFTTRVYQADYDKVFNAVVNTCEYNGYPVMVINKESGIVATDYKSSGAILGGRAKIRLDFHITKTDGDFTKVRLNIYCEMSRLRDAGGRDTELANNLINEDEYEKIFDIIGQEINKKQ